MKMWPIVLALACAIPELACATVSQSVTLAVTTPGDGATLTSPIAVQASATSSHNISGWRIYVDGVDVYHTGSASSISASLPLAVGAHSLTVSATSNGSSASVTRSITVVQSAPAMSITVSPASVALQVGLSQQFNATVTGATNTGVSWLVNGVSGGNSTLGTISTTGLYKAPASVPSGGSVTVQAVSVADANKSATATVMISAAPATVSVTVSPSSATLQGGKNQQFTASVTGTTNTAVNWYVAGIQGGNASVGVVSDSGVYTAPACPSQTTQTVTARSVYDTSASANATVMLSAAPAGNGSYYVANNGSDANDGSACHPWATIAHADSALALGTTGTTVHVASGSYAGASTSKSGTSSARIRYISDTEWGARITSPWYSRGNYVDIVGFEMTAPTQETAIEALGAYTRILHNYVHDIGTQISTCFSAGAIYLGTVGSGFYGHNVADSNIVRNMGNQAARPCNQAHGVYLAGPYNTATNNLISGVVGYGIHLWHDTCYDLIVNNTVFENDQGGIIVGNGDNAGGCTVNDYTTVNNNIVVNNGYDGRYGISDGGSVGGHNVYMNNVVYNNKPGNFYLSTGNTATGTLALTSTQFSALFVNYQANGSGDYDLAATSPAINAGTSACASGVSSCAPAFDFEGGSRPSSTYWDAGAYEYGATARAWPWY